jgi:hypothetical protein
MQGIDLPRRYFLLLLLFGESFGQSGSFKVVNLTGLARKSDAVVISRENLKSLMSIPKEQVPVLFSEGRMIPSQVDDLTRDGIWDELVFQVDMERNSSLELKVKWVSPANFPSNKERVNAFLGVRDNDQSEFKPSENELLPEDWHSGMAPQRYQNEGPVWESEQIAFRYLLDERHFCSVLGKNREVLLKDSLRILNSNPIKPESWGMEVLPYDSGMGAGGFALRAGENWYFLKSAGSTQFRKIASGPVRTVFDLLYEDWMAGETALNVRRRISIWAGKSSYKTELQISGFNGELDLAIGLSLPGQDILPSQLPLNKDYAALFWRRGQAHEDNGTLSLGLLLPASGIKGFSGLEKSQAAALQGSCYANFSISSGQSIDFQTFAVWEKSNERFSNAMNFRNLMQTEADYLESPLKVIP